MTEGKSAQQKKFYKFEDRRGGRGGGRGRGGRGGGRGGGGGGRGGGRGRGGGGGFRGGRGGGGGEVSGPWDSDGVSKPSHLGRYRDDPLPDLITAPGILVTAVQNKEKSAERELVEALEQIADELYPETGQGKGSEEEEEEEDDMEAMLQKELNGISSDEKSKRIRLCRHDTPCLFYINLLPPLDPLRIVDHLLRQIEKTAKCPFKFVRRVVPITSTCTATINNLKSISGPVIKAGFESEEGKPLKFAVVVNTRNSHKLDRLEMIKTVAENVEALGAGHTVDLGQPDRTIIIEVNKNTLGTSVLKDYDTLKKYNVVEIAKTAAVAAGKSVSEAVAGSEPGPEVEQCDVSIPAEGGSTEKRKVDEMEVDESAIEQGGEDRAAKQLKV